MSEEVRAEIAAYVAENFPHLDGAFVDDMCATLAAWAAPPVAA